MSRTLSASVNSYISQPSIRFYTLAEIDLVGGTLRTFNGAGFMMVGANTYAGVGDLGSIETIKEDADEFGRGVKMGLTAVMSSNLLSVAMNEQLFNREVRLYRCWWDPSSNAVVNTPEVWFRGRINEVNIYRGDEERGDYIETVLESGAQFERRPSYYTPEDLGLVYSGDTFFNFTQFIPGFKALWGQKPTYFGVGGGGQSLPGYGGFGDALIEWARRIQGG